MKTTIKDQADQLRHIMESAGKALSDSAETKTPGRAEAVVFVSCDGETETDGIISGTALSLQRAGRKVLIVNMDSGTNPEGSQTPRALKGMESDSVVIHKTPQGLEQLRGVQKAVFPPAHGAHNEILDALEEVESRYELMFTKTGYIVGCRQMNVLRAADRVVIVVSGKEESVFQAYALLKDLARTGHAEQVSILICGCRHAADGQRIFDRIASTAYRRLGARLNFLGAIQYHSFSENDFCFRQDRIDGLADGSGTVEFKRITGNNIWNNDLKRKKMRKRSFFRKIAFSGGI